MSRRERHPGPGAAPVLTPTYDETLVQTPKHVPQDDELAQLLADGQLGQHSAQEGQLAVVWVLVLSLPADSKCADLCQQRSTVSKPCRGGV